MDILNRRSVPHAAEIATGDTQVRVPMGRRKSSGDKEDEDAQAKTEMRSMPTRCKHLCHDSFGRFTDKILVLGVLAIVAAQAIVVGADVTG